VDVSPKDFNDLKQIYESLEDKLKYLKQRKFCGFFSPDFFAPKEKLYDVCDVCNLTPWPKRETCDICKIHERVGQIAPHTTAIGFIYTDCNYLKDANVEVVPFPKFTTAVVFIPSDKEESIANRLLNESAEGILYKLNTILFLPEFQTAKLSFGFKFIGNEAPLAKEQLETRKGEEPIEKNEVLSFDKIADMSSGTRLLGVLKADVDYLGSLFYLGIEPKMTISRISSLSTGIDFFFTGYLNKICEDLAEKWHSNPENQNSLKGRVDGLFYIVYSGGDDLFIIGPWDQIIELAKEINSSFRRYTCENPNLSISAGVLMVKPHFPVQRFAQLVGEQLELSKSDADKRAYERKKPYEKKRITLFGETAVWEDSHLAFEQLLSFGKELERYINEKKLPRTFLHFLQRLYKQYLESNEDRPKPLWTPKFLYSLTRRVKDENTFVELLKKVPTFKEKIRIPLWYAILKTRKEV
jgi:CRISPR-associated protein Csm1